MNAMHMNLIDCYNRHAFTHNYIFGFIDRKNVYMVTTTNKVLPYVTKLDTASRSAGASLRYRPTHMMKELLKVSGSVELVCSESYFNEMVKNSIYNRGEIFEKLVTEKFGQQWVKDNVPFYKGGDVTHNGVAYQIKFDNATFLTESKMIELG